MFAQKIKAVSDFTKELARSESNLWAFLITLSTINLYVQTYSMCSDLLNTTTFGYIAKVFFMLWLTMSDPVTQVVISLVWMGLILGGLFAAIYYAIKLGRYCENVLSFDYIKIQKIIIKEKA